MLSPSRERALAALAFRQHGVVTVGQLAALGISGRAVEHGVAAWRLHRVHHGVYAVGHARLAPEGRRIAAVLAGPPGTVLSHRSAGAVWAICADDPRRWHVTVPLGGRVAGSTVLAHQTRRLDRDEWTAVRGVPVTTVSRTLVDLASTLRARGLERAVNEAQVLGLLDVGEVLAVADRRPGVRGTARLRQLLGATANGVTRSVLEQRFTRLCRRTGLPLPVRNAEVPVPGGTLEVDALWEDERVVVELDGAAAHHTRLRFENDRRKDAALAVAGYVVVRFTWRRMVSEPMVLAAEVRALLDLRRSESR